MAYIHFDNYLETIFQVPTCSYNRLTAISALFTAAIYCSFEKSRPSNGTLGAFSISDSDP